MKKSIPAVLSLKTAVSKGRVFFIVLQDIITKKNMEILCFYAIRNQNVMYFLTFTVIDWVDIFSRKIYRDIVIESLKICQKSKGVILDVFVPPIPNPLEKYGYDMGLW